MKIGELIREQRKKIDMNQSELARRIGVNRATVSRWEKDEINVDRKRIEDICNVLAIDPVIFFHQNDVFFPEEIQLVNAWRSSDELTKELVRRTLHMDEKKDASRSAI